MEGDVNIAGYSGNADAVILAAGFRYILTVHGNTDAVVRRAVRNMQSGTEGCTGGNGPAGVLHGDSTVRIKGDIVIGSLDQGAVLADGGSEGIGNGTHAGGVGRRSACALARRVMGQSVKSRARTNTAANRLFIEITSLLGPGNIFVLSPVYQKPSNYVI